jgi:hypothetical protein
MAKKAATRRAARPSSSRTAAGGKVTVLVNGSIAGERPAEGTIGEMATKLAQDNGLKAYSIRANGVPVTVAEAAHPISGVKTLEIFAKDTRG